MSRVTY
ncbi:Protein of unknown function [Leuconostoc citreum]|nr:Protein of unknown function [Leuconostoc citreum]CDX66069.1 Protein of unknown function [Leuconostoc citreum]